MRDAQIVRRSAWHAMRDGAHHAMTRDDLMQEGWLAALEADAAGRAPAGGHHRAAYLTMRTLGAMRDARRRMPRQVPEHDGRDPPAGVDDGEALIDRAHVQGQLRRLRECRAMTPAMRQVLDALVAGDTIAEIARARGCSISAVYKVADRLDWLAAMLR